MTGPPNFAILTINLALRCHQGHQINHVNRGSTCVLGRCNVISDEKQSSLLLDRLLISVDVKSNPILQSVRRSSMIQDES